jgi:hypothetical protein
MNTNQWKAFKDAMPKGPFVVGRMSPLGQWEKGEYIRYAGSACSGFTHFCEITIPEPPPPPRKSKLDEAWEKLREKLPKSSSYGELITRGQFTCGWNACLMAHGIKEE